MRTETRLHGLWLCNRCGEATENSLCPNHDTAWIVLDYYENWTLTDRSAAAGYCGPCERADGTKTNVTIRVCTTHGRRDPFRTKDYKSRASTTAPAHPRVCADSVSESAQPRALPQVAA